MTRTAIAGTLAAALAASGGPAATAARADTVIRNVTVVETVDGTLTPGRALVIRGGIIAAVTADADTAPAPGDTVIDAAGAFVVPGYIDMHAHGLVAPVQAEAEGGDHVHVEPSAGQAVFNALFLANGVTGFRQMSGSPELVHLARAMNAASAAGEVAAPRWCRCRPG